MILGNGVDLVEIQRIKEIIERKPRFINRFFTKNEYKIFESKGFKTETIAGNFAAKEAVVKAMGTGVRGFDLVDIEVLRDEMGKPYVVLHGRAKAVALGMNVGEIHLSISHSQTQAVAFAIAMLKI